VKSIGYDAFLDCVNLCTLYFNVISANDVEFYWDQMSFENAGAESGGIDVVVGDSVEKIPANIFAVYPGGKGANIRSLSFTSNSVCRSIGDSAFYFCSALKTVTLPSRLTSLGANAFNACPLLEEVIFLSKNVVISSSAINKSASLFGYAGSTAETFATKNGRAFEAFDGETTADGLSWSISPINRCKSWL
jgi:hypothetical protein